MAQVIIVDDHDRSRIRYAGGTWFAAGSPNEYAQTTFGTRDAGSRATFVFSGSSVKVYGTVPEIGVSSIAPISTYSVDGSSSTTFAPSLGSSPEYRKLFYASPPLKDGEHTLVITSIVKDCFFWLDYIEYTPTSLSKPPSTPPQENAPIVVTTNVVETTPRPVTITTDTPENSKGSPTSTPSTGAKSTPSNSEHAPKPESSSDFERPGIGTTTLGATETPSESSIPLMASGSNKVPTGAIAGAAVGGAFILLVLLLLIWRCRRKAARTQYIHNHSEISPVAGRRMSIWSRAQPSTTITPFSMSETPPSTALRSPGDGPADGAQERRLTGAHMSSPTYGYGYTTYGGTAEKSGLNSATPTHSRSQSRSVGDSATGLIRDPSEGSSQYGGSTTSAPAQSFPHNQAGGVSYAPIPDLTGLTSPRSDGAGSLYNSMEEDMPPAYRRTLDGSNFAPG
ncbi:hypothetical protein BDZ94DRAFT_1271524 [Collybia nuda]|uniref:Uncharacterized protein n=1 Tax=Collybia nuda TaxID=64659 RepID=A0A9P6CAB8_9AGAR|nr:hypothetical protein BDZ94DRAFT_1271524 [Collybia nuda]